MMDDRNYLIPGNYSIKKRMYYALKKARRVASRRSWAAFLAGKKWGILAGLALGVVVTIILMSKDNKQLKKVAVGVLKVKGKMGGKTV